MKTLSFTLPLSVRFSETDAMGVIWHGNYLKYFEDAREEFGKRYNLEYISIHQQGYFVPIVKSEIEHKASVYYGEEIEIFIELIQLKSAKILFNYKVYSKSTRILVAQGSTTQVFLDKTTRTLELNKPDFYTLWEKEQTWIERE